MRLLDNYLGINIIGILLTTFFYGVLSFQIYKYFFRYGYRDSRLVKGTVVVIWVLETFHSFLLWHSLYYYCVTSFANPVALARTLWSFELSIGTGAILVVLVQAFYTIRIYRLIHDRRILVVIVPIALVQLGCSLAVTVKWLQTKWFFGAMLKRSILTIIPLVCSIIVDTFISFTLIYFLHKGRSGFRSSNRVINLLIMYTINTCLLTTVCVALTLALYTAMPHNFIFSPFYLVICKLYVNSMLSALNSRASIRAKLSTQINLDEFCVPDSLPRMEEVANPGEAKTPTEPSPSTTLAQDFPPAVNVRRVTIEIGLDEELGVRSKTGLGSQISLDSGVEV